MSLARRHKVTIEALQARLAEVGAERDRYREALERIAERPCQAPDEHPSKVGECPDYWAIGMSKEACPPCIARQALSDPELRHG